MKTQLKEYMLNQFEAITAIPSPTGFTKMAQDYVVEELKKLGYEPTTLVKGGVLVELGALRSHFNSPALSVEQFYSEFLLKIAYVGTDGGLRKERRVSGLAETLVPHNIDKSFDLFEIH